MLTIYKFLLNTLYVVAQPVIAVMKWRSPDQWRQRLVRDGGNNPKENAADMQRDANQGPCLFHASSVGEVGVLMRLIDAVRKIHPDLPYCVSTFTPAGNKLAREHFVDAQAVCFFPLDCHAPLKRFFDHYHPRGVVIVETEIWPYFLDYCRRFNLPVVLANGRLSSGSVRWYKLFRGSLSRVFRVYRAFLMQTSGDRERMLAIGADPQKMRVLGNIKHDFDESIDRAARRIEVRKRLGLTDDTFLFIAASTHPGEEGILCRAFESVGDFPDRVTVLLAPRHLKRLDDVRRILEDKGCPYTLYSDLKSGEPSPTPVILMDEMGLLAELFYGADLAFVGGTLTDVGGHNVMEPVLAGVPTLFGPSTKSVRDAAEKIIAENLGGMVHDSEELATAVNDCVARKISYGRIKPGDIRVADQTAQIVVRELGL